MGARLSLQTNIFPTAFIYIDSCWIGLFLYQSDHNSSWQAIYNAGWEKYHGRLQRIHKTFHKPQYQIAKLFSICSQEEIWYKFYPVFSNRGNRWTISKEIMHFVSKNIQKIIKLYFSSSNSCVKFMFRTSFLRIIVLLRFSVTILNQFKNRWHVGVFKNSCLKRSIESAKLC